jgi:hypothetical protein
MGSINRSGGERGSRFLSLVGGVMSWVLGMFLVWRGKVWGWGFRCCFGEIREGEGGRARGKLRGEGKEDEEWWEGVEEYRAEMWRDY